MPLYTRTPCTLPFTACNVAFAKAHAQGKPSAGATALRFTPRHTPAFAVAAARTLPLPWRYRLPRVRVRVRLAFVLSVA